MTAEDFLLSAVALFVFFFVVTPVLHRLCSRAGEQTKPVLREGAVSQTETMRRVS